MNVFLVYRDIKDLLREEAEQGERTLFVRLFEEAPSLRVLGVRLSDGIIYAMTHDGEKTIGENSYYYLA